MSGTENQYNTISSAYSEWDKENDAWFSLTPSLDINFWVGFENEKKIEKARIYPVDMGNTDTREWVDVTPMLLFCRWQMLEDMGIIDKWPLGSIAWS